MAERRCPKCTSSMEEGFIVDHTYGQQQQETWVEGPPKRSFWQGISLRGAEQLSVITYRCSRCGFLEAYAQRPS